MKDDIISVISFILMFIILSGCLKILLDDVSVLLTYLIFAVCYCVVDCEQQ